MAGDDLMVSSPSSNKLFDVTNIKVQIPLTFDLKDVWDSLKGILHDNKVARGIQLEDDLQKIEIGDLCITDDFQKINTLARLY